MSTTLTYGQKLPSNGDRGFWDDLAFNINHLDAHSHDGVNSIKIRGANIEKSPQNILAANWTAVAGQTGTFKQTVTMPPGISLGTTAITFFITSSGHFITPTVERVTATTYDVFVNDNTIGLTALYG